MFPPGLHKLVIEPLSGPCSSQHASAAAFARLAKLPVRLHFASWPPKASSRSHAWQACGWLCLNSSWSLLLNFPSPDLLSVPRLNWDVYPPHENIIVSTAEGSLGLFCLSLGWAPDTTYRKLSIFWVNWSDPPIVNTNSLNTPPGMVTALPIHTSG